MTLLLALLLLQSQDDLRQGLTALNGNDLPHARQSLEKAVKQEPENAIAWMALAQTYAKSERKDLALGAAARAEKIAGNTPAVQHALELFYAGLSQALLEKQDFAGALGVLETAQRQFPKDPQIVLAWGVACYAQRRPEDAVSAFLRVIALDDSIEQPYVFLGRILEHTGDRLPEVIEDYAAWEKRAPDNYLPVFLHAKAMLELAQPAASEIEARLRRSIELNAGYWESHGELGALLLRENRFGDAEEELRRAIALSPSQPKPHYDLARVYLRLGKTGLARAERETYDRLKTDDASPH